MLNYIANCLRIKLNQKLQKKKVNTKSEIQLKITQIINTISFIYSRGMFKFNESNLRY